MIVFMTCLLEWLDMDQPRMKCQVFWTACDLMVFSTLLWPTFSANRFWVLFVARKLWAKTSHSTPKSLIYLTQSLASHCPVVTCLNTKGSSSHSSVPTESNLCFASNFSMIQSELELRSAVIETSWCRLNFELRMGFTGKLWRYNYINFIFTLRLLTQAVNRILSPNLTHSLLSALACSRVRTFLRAGAHCLVVVTA